MRQLANTVSIKLRTLEAFKNQVGHIRLHRLGQKSRQVDVACRNLEASIARLGPLITEVSRLQMTTQKGETVLKWRSTLRNRSLRPLAGEAKAHLHIKLTAPHKEASNADYVAAGEKFSRTLRPHLPALIAAGMDDDCLDLLETRTAKLKQWTTQQSSGAKTLRAVKDQEKAEMTRARDLAKALDGHMVALCEDEPGLLKPWKEARRIPKRIGQKREWGGHLQADKRKPKRDRSPTGRPFDYDVPPESPPPAPEEPPTSPDPPAPS